MNYLNLNKITDHNIFGLKYVPWFMRNDDNYKDSDGLIDAWVQENYPELPLYHGENGLTFTEANCAILKDCVLNLGSGCQTIMEIGMARDHPIFNSSKVLLDNKPSTCRYLGVDLRDLSEYHQPDKNQFFVRSDSRNQQLIRQKLKEYGFEQLDILFIDGFHSMETFLNDWMYADLVRIGGYVVYHDSSHHPGPHLFFDAIDETKFQKSRHCLYDFGIAVAKRIA